MRSTLIFVSILFAVLGDSYFNTKCDISLNRCFKFVSSPATYSDAEETCIKEGGHLVSIENGFVEGTIAESAPHAFSMPNFSDFWIGANFIFNNRWSWTVGTEFKYTNWAPGQPSNNQTAAMQLRTNNWVNSNPSTAKPFVCEMSLQSPPVSTPTSCPETIHCDWGWTRYTNFCYKSFFNATFFEAEDVCTQHDSHLVSIHSNAENIFVSELAASGTIAPDFHEGTRIGLYRTNENTAWVWTDKTNVDYTAWVHDGTHPSNPVDLLCIVLFADGTGDDGHYRKWNNEPLEEFTRNFICKKPAK